jgi:hypothetical protein
MSIECCGAQTVCTALVLMPLVVCCLQSLVEQAHAETLAALQHRLFEVWGDADDIQTQVLASQAARQAIAAAATNGTAGMSSAGPRL